jgi:hypothetical protein
MGWALALVALAVSVSSAADATGDKVLLKQKFTPGVWTMGTMMTVEDAVTVDGTPRPDRKESRTFVWVQDIGQPDKDGAKTMKMTLKQVKHSINIGAQTAGYDSAGPADKQDPNAARVLGPILKAKIVATIGADGKVASVTGLSETWDAVAKDAPEMAAVATQMKAQMGDNAIKDMITKPSEMLPDKAVGVGDEWQPTMKLDIPLSGEGEVKQTCKLLEIQAATAGKIAVIQYEGTAKSTKETTAPMGAVTVKIQSVTSAQKGQVRFNIDTGMIESLTVSTESTIALTAPGPEGKTENVVTKQKAKADIAVTKGEAAPAAK